MSKKFRTVVDLDAKTYKRLNAITKRHFTTKASILRRLVAAFLKAKGKGYGF